MTTLVRLAKRAKGMDVEAFHREAACAADWSGAARHELRAATQSLTLKGAYRDGGEPVYDVVDELVFADEARARRCLQDPGLRANWEHDLLDRSSIAALITEEYVVKAEPVGRSYVKNYEIVTKLPSMDAAEFDRYWADRHGPLAAQIPTIRRYVQLHLAPDFREDSVAPFDGMAVTWFDDVAAMRDSLRYPVYQRTREDECNFLAGELPFIIATERITFGA